MTFNGTTIAGAVTSTINNTTAGNTLALGAITRNPGGLLSFGTGGTTTTGSGSNGLLGTYAYTGTGTSLNYVSSGTIAPYTAGTTAANATGVTDTTGTVNYNVGAGGAVGTGASVNTLRYTGAMDTISNPISLNGLMNAGTGTLTVSGAVTIGANNELVVLNDTQSTIISGPIANNGNNASALTYGGPSAGSADSQWHQTPTRVPPRSSAGAACNLAPEAQPDRCLQQRDHEQRQPDHQPLQRRDPGDGLQRSGADRTGILHASRHGHHDAQRGEHLHGSDDGERGSADHRGHRGQFRPVWDHQHGGSSSSD